MSDIDNPDIWLTRARSSLARAGQVLCLKLRRVTCISLTNKQKSPTTTTKLAQSMVRYAS
ncbi:MAG: hypothetical protein IPO06_07635 [Leptospiraceae bacterium]|nr:hypothetical protein [Leptospiraceae bacterium]